MGGTATSHNLVLSTKYLVKKILIIEDNTVTRKLIELTLEIDWYTVYQASNGEAGIQMTKDINPDLILLDIDMPGGISGLTVCDIIKSTPTLSHIPIIIVSGNSDEAYKVMLQNLGASEFIAKPFTPYGLLETIQQHMPYDLT